MRVLVVGTGSIGQRHMRNLRTLAPEVDFDVYARPERSRREPLEGATYSESLAEAISKAPDLMVIANPSALHLPFLLSAIENEIPFYIEKPVVAKADELEVLKQAARGRRLPTNIVGCNLRFLPSLHRLRDIVQSGELGNIARGSFEAGQWLPDWRPQQDYRTSYSAKRDMGGGVMLDLIHETDAALWIMGDFNRSAAFAARTSSLEIETEDCACMLLGQSAGPVAVVQLDYVSRVPCRKYRIVGDAGTAEWDLFSRRLTLSRATGTTLVTTTEADFDVGATYISAMSAFLAAIAEKRPTSVPLEEGVRALELTLAAQTPEQKRQ